MTIEGRWRLGAKRRQSRAVPAVSSVCRNRQRRDLASSSLCSDEPVDRQIRRQPRHSGPRFSRVTWDAAFSTEPALSRDGTLVVYTSDRGGGGQLDLVAAEGRGRSTGSFDRRSNDDREPDFSPDGSLIAFRSDRGGGGVYVMPALAGTPACGGRRTSSALLSRRQTHRLLDGTVARVMDAARVWAPRVLWSRRSAANRRPSRTVVWTARNPVWSPDGQSLLFFGRKAIG